MYYPRLLEEDIRRSIATNPVTAIIGPRQCGKSTLAANLLQRFEKVRYLDLERPSDMAKLDDAEWFFESNRDSLICIDEIQRKPELFPVIRSVTDRWDQNGKFLILGSASRELLRQNSESLAGRISYKQLTPFLYSEIAELKPLEQYITRGGSPEASWPPAQPSPTTG
jgi:hypothetical protein